MYAYLTRFMLVLLSHGFSWKDALVNVTPKTFIGWHGAGFRLFWRWKSRPGRPRIPAELRALIREMALRNPVRSKYSCGFPMVIFQQPIQAFFTGNRSVNTILCLRGGWK